MPDQRSLVGIQKLAAANSNVATRHILDASLFLTVEAAEQLSLRVSDIIEYSPTKDAFIQAIGAHNVATLEEMSTLHLYDFGIFITLQPDAEEKQVLENNIQMALQQKLIDLDDAIDLREVKNLKMANQLLKIRRKKKAERDQKLAERNMQMQSQTNQQAAQAASQAKMQEKQANTQSEIELEKARNEMRIQYLKEEAALKRKLMDHEFEINKKLQGMQADAKMKSDSNKEDRKDQREENKQAPRFESSGNDVMGQGLDINA
jgi:hypothetical protein